MKKLKKLFLSMILGLTICLTMTVVISQNVVATEAAAPKLSDKNLELMPKEYYQITVKNAGMKKVSWKTSDKNVVTVNKKGVVHAVGEMGQSCTITAKVGKQNLKCKIKILKVKYVDMIGIYWSNWTYSGFDVMGKHVEGVVPGYMEIVKYKNNYYWYTETEGDSQGTEYVAYEYTLNKIGKKLPGYIKNPSYCVWKDDGTSYVVDNKKDIPKDATGIPAVNILYDSKGNMIVERAHHYTDKEWKARVKQLGYK